MQLRIGLTAGLLLVALAACGAGNTEPGSPAADAGEEGEKIATVYKSPT